MAVYTEVPPDEAAALLRRLNLGELSALQGIQGGIENTNYFATTDRGEWVLTVFERLSFEQLPFYLRLMKHLAQRDIPVPEPAGDTAGELVHPLCGKPAAVVNRLRGASELQPSTRHCEQVGAMLARMHLAGRDFPALQPNLRALPWWAETVPVVLPHVQPQQAALLRAELAYQQHVATTSTYAALPRGPIHADLFRDNVLFDAGQLAGFFDFYFAGVDTWLFDVAVCLNDWCVDIGTGREDAERRAAFLAAYQAVRPLTSAERHLLPSQLRAGALRFWISRLWDFHLPREASMLKAHDPSHFERVLRGRIAELATAGPSLGWSAC